LGSEFEALKKHHWRKPWDFPPAFFTKFVRGDSEEMHAIPVASKDSHEKHSGPPGVAGVGDDSHGFFRVVFQPNFQKSGFVPGAIRGSWQGFDIAFGNAKAFPDSAVANRFVFAYSFGLCGFDFGLGNQKNLCQTFFVTGCRSEWSLFRAATKSKDGIHLDDGFRDIQPPGGPEKSNYKKGKDYHSRQKQTDAPTN
jgi:hypothetical protein